MTALELPKLGEICGHQFNGHHLEQLGAVTQQLAMTQLRNPHCRRS